MHDYCAICKKPPWDHAFAETYAHRYESALAKGAKTRA